MRKNMAALIMLLSIALLITGCWNRKELNELAIAAAAGVDKVGDRYRLTVQVVDPGQVTAQKGANGGAPATLYTIEGDTVFEAARRLTQISPRKIYFSHLRIFLIGESLARQGIGEMLDFLFRDPGFRPDFYLAVAKEASALETLKIMTPLEPVPANKLFSSLETSEQNWSPSLAITLDELIGNLASSGQSPVLTALEITGDPKIGESKENISSIYTPTQLKFSGLAAFNKDKLIGWLNEQESRGYHDIHGGVKSTVMFVRCPDNGKVVIEFLRSKSKVKGKVIDGKPQIDIQLTAEGNVGASGCKKLNIIDPDTIGDLEKKTEEKLIEFMEAAIEKAQKEFKTDIFGFGEAIHRNNPKYWKSLEPVWNEKYFPELPVNIKADFMIRRIGMTTDPVIKQIKE
ncbi:Ger(x)C family spore germination protein [Paenibacillus macerans]|uniref:Ger(x)C family spore germination protein n=1 Tax=Paenibacillus macerans TaxID=44252 RepID=UPI00203DF37E|nr:Ger(x)C family spore germination protein [Paenibacillus macerans]MCM3703609.1 Ger(x)C family spore germination protein [Paenibacillus macerans]